MASACMFSQLGPCSTADQISVLGSQDMQEIYSLYLPHAVKACNHSVSLQGNIPREEDEGKLVELGVRSVEILLAPRQNPSGPLLGLTGQ
jgi:hypothetical protein